MPTPVVKQFNAWSYSRLKDYETCPLRAKLKHLDKLAEPGSAAMDRGTSIHTMAQNYADGTLVKLPPELKLFKNEFTQLKKRTKAGDVEFEIQMALTNKWEPTGWFDANAWCRIIMDARYKDGDTWTIIDHKTGKIRDEQLDQLDLYGLAAFCLPGTTSMVLAQLWYLDQGEIRERRYGIGEAGQLKTVWEKRVKRMLNDQKFKPQPSNFCRWCHYSKTKNGPCPY